MQGIWGDVPGVTKLVSAVGGILDCGAAKSQRGPRHQEQTSLSPYASRAHIHLAPRLCQALSYKNTFNLLALPQKSLFFVIHFYSEADYLNPNSKHLI